MSNTTDPIESASTCFREESADWGSSNRRVTVPANSDGLEIHQLEADLERMAGRLGIDLESLADTAGRHFTSDTIVPSHVEISEDQLDQLAKDELDAFRN